MSADFKSLLRAHRLYVGYGLRAFAELIGDAPSNYAAVESGARSPWRSEEKLRAAAKFLMLEENSKDWREFFDAARVSGALPLDMQDLFDRPMALQLMRTVDERRLSEEELRAVVEYIRRKFKKSRHDP
jgi:transcriptional regulator with XRE-family HTH domain